MNNSMEITIAVSTMKDQIPKDATLKERLAFAMAYVIKHERDLFWMSYKIDDDLLFRTALAAVMITGNESDQDIITRSLQPLKMLAAAVSGIPVDFTQLESGDDLLPLMAMFKDAKAAPSGKDAGAKG